jgi:hypothetical protein
MWNSLKRIGHKRPTLKSITLAIPYVGNFTFVPEESEIRAAWSILIELSTRAPVQPLDPDYGSIREALSSIYALFGETRRILSQAGPSIFHGDSSLAPIAISFLNKGLRPFLTRWHYELQLHEKSFLPSQQSRVEHEKEWPKLGEFKKEYAILQTNLETYQIELKKLSGVIREE